MQPLPELSGSVLAARMPAAAASDFVEWGPAATADQQFDVVLKQEIPLEQLVREYPNIPALSDDEPINEYFLLRLSMNAPR
jgi:hypothetical protein